MKLSIIIPVYNEKNTILEIVDIVKKVDLGSIEKEIILVDDFSTDGTRDLLKDIHGCKVFYHKENLGKGATVKDGFMCATGDIFVIQDADLEYDPIDLIKLIKYIKNGETSVVYGSRFMHQDIEKYKSYKKNLLSHYLGNKFLSLMTSVLYGVKLTDMETCYKMFRKEVIGGMKINSKRFEFEPEITAKILKRGYKILEVPISYSARDFSEGKKINWRDGLKAFYYIVKYKFLD